MNPIEGLVADSAGGVRRLSAPMVAGALWMVVTLVVTLGLAVSTTRIARAEQPRNDAAARLVARVGWDAIAVYAHGIPPEAEARAAFSRILQRSFDVDAIGRSALGVHWHRTPAAVRRRYLAAFRVHLTDAYADMFRRYRGERMVVRGSRTIRQNQSLVTTHMRRQDRTVREIAWRVNHNGGAARIIDLFVDGISLTKLKRDDFAAFLARHDGAVPALTAALTARRFRASQ